MNELVSTFMREKVETLQAALLQLPQYEPETRHYFHGGMYCREVYRAADVVVVGKVHRKEHFYVIVAGTVVITDGINPPREVTGPEVLLSKPGTKRAVMSITPAVCMTFHTTQAATVEEAEAELVEEDEHSAFDAGNKVKPGVLRHEFKELSP